MGDKYTIRAFQRIAADMFHIEYMLDYIDELDPEILKLLPRPKFSTSSIDEEVRKSRDILEETRSLCLNHLSSLGAFSGGKAKRCPRCKRFTIISKVRCYFCAEFLDAEIGERAPKLTTEKKTDGQE
jgi:hypothetical protein